MSNNTQTKYKKIKDVYDSMQIDLSGLSRKYVSLRNVNDIDFLKELSDSNDDSEPLIISYTSYVWRGAFSKQDENEDISSFESIVDTILRSDRSWAGVYDIKFEWVSPTDWVPGMLKIVLVSGNDAERICGMNNLSCYVTHSSVSESTDMHKNNDHTIYINADNWNCTSEACSNAGRDEDDPEYMSGYRYYVISHEVGHSLGFDHAKCELTESEYNSGKRSPAPIMMQQTKGIGYCSVNDRPAMTYEIPVLMSSDKTLDSKFLQFED